MTKVENGLGIEVILLFIVIIVTLGSVFYIFITTNLEGHKNNRSPITEVYAVVYETEVVVTGQAKNIHGSPINLRSLQVTFHTGNDMIITLMVPESQYSNMQEGAKGMLTYQRNKFLSFEPEENTNKKD